MLFRQLASYNVVTPFTTLSVSQPLTIIAELTLICLIVFFFIKPCIPYTSLKFLLEFQLFSCLYLWPQPTILLFEITIHLLTHFLSYSSTPQEEPEQNGLPASPLGDITETKVVDSAAWQPRRWASSGMS